MELKSENHVRLTLDELKNHFDFLASPRCITFTLYYQVVLHIVVLPVRCHLMPAQYRSLTSALLVGAFRLSLVGASLSASSLCLMVRDPGRVALEYHLCPVGLLAPLLHVAGFVKLVMWRRLVASSRGQSLTLTVRQKSSTRCPIPVQKHFLWSCVATRCTTVSCRVSHSAIIKSMSDEANAIVVAYRQFPIAMTRDGFALALGGWERFLSNVIPSSPSICPECNCTDVAFAVSGGVAFNVLLPHRVHCPSTNGKFFHIHKACSHESRKAENSHRRRHGCLRKSQSCAVRSLRPAVLQQCSPGVALAVFRRLPLQIPSNYPRRTRPRAEGDCRP